MKNNEILVSARFENGDALHEEFAVLVQNDISLKSLLEAFYYGIGKLKGQDEVQELLDKYLQTRKQLQILYTARGEHQVIDVTETVDDVSVLEMSINHLGFVTCSCLLFTLDPVVRPAALFLPEDCSRSKFLQRGDTLEYNISTRRLNVIEPSVVDILPPGDMPQRDKGSFWDMVIPTLLSTGGMLGARYLIMAISPSAASMGNTMLLMSGAMGVVSLVTSVYNFVKKRREYKGNVAEWKENYENYIARVIATIKEWQVSDIKYLNSTYPNVEILFQNTRVIDGSIFSRSQNDNDFMRISLGTSDEVKPLFEIKSEKKDNIFYDIKYKKIGDRIEIYLPPKKKKHHSKQTDELQNERGRGGFLSFISGLFAGKEARRVRKLTEEQRKAEQKNRFLLTELPVIFANKGVDSSNKTEIVGFNYLRSDNGMKPPLLLDLRSSGALGVVSDDPKTSAKFIRHLAFELAYYHSPEDLQFVFFFDPTDDPAEQDKALKYYKYLPHTNELLDGVSQFVFDKDSAGVVFGQLLSIMNTRAQERGEEKDEENPEPAKFTQIVCVVFNDYNIKATGFSKYLPEVPKEGEPYVNENGLTFIFVQPDKDLLPKYCGNIVDIDKNNTKERKSSLRYNVLSRETLNVLSEGGEAASQDKASTTDKLIEYKHFENDYIFEENGNVWEHDFERAFRQLSAIYYTRIAENGQVPSMVTLFELYKFASEKDVEPYINEHWDNQKENDVTRNLRVPIGANEHGSMDLDLYEKADGPHMLVAGTTGSGKSETIITYLIGLCMKFTPLDLNLMLVDMKGGGFSDRLGDLPHCVGVVTDTAGESEGTSAAYMLKRFLESLNAEIKRRKLLLTSLGVDNVDAYIRAVRTIRDIRKMQADGVNSETIQSAMNKLNEKQLEALNSSDSELVPLSHLVLVVDEFTELKRFSNESNDVDFIAEITTIARVGRTLGFHIILVSQNIEGAITDDIRVNSKARICLKVATKQASKEMLGSPVAAAPTMPLNGRAYLLVGTGSRFEYFQSAYTGANKDTNLEKPVIADLVPNSGRHIPGFYNSRKDNLREKQKNDNINPNDTQLAYVVKTIIRLGSELDEKDKPKQIFLPPLPSRIVDVTEWRK